jgi:tryptophan 2,3-dioxygenase
MPKITWASAPINYSSYLRLDTLLDCQQLESAKAGNPAHDEMVFIVTHQTYELWFKQILHELEAVLGIMGQPVVPERELGKVLRYLERIVTIQQVLVEQIGILETMTPLDFLDFRDSWRLVRFSKHAVPPDREYWDSNAPSGSHNAMPYEAALSSDSKRQVRRKPGQPVRHRRAAARQTPFPRFRDYDFGKL